MRWSFLCDGYCKQAWQGRLESHLVGNKCLNAKTHITAPPLAIWYSSMASRSPKGKSS